MLIFGTRPEIIKLAPVLDELRKHRNFVETITVLTAQHREMADQLLDVFDIKPDYDLDIMLEDQSLSELTSRLTLHLDQIFNAQSVDYLVVQGDTTTTFVSSLVAFYHKIPVAHVEAGLRTGDRSQPFPEEMNRLMTTRLADLHFAPTEPAKQNLIREGVDASRIHVTGNTVTDALHSVMSRERISITQAPAQRKILVTAHRRENIGAPIENICDAILRITEQFEDVTVVMPVHPNPRVSYSVNKIIGGHKRIKLSPPLSYRAFVKELASSYLVVTDSGGVQEEAPSLGKPVIVTREVTERTEGVDSGNCILVGTSTQPIVDAVAELLTNSQAYERASRRNDLYGDGTASSRIAQYLLSALGVTS